MAKLRKKYNYSYPNGLDLTPGSKLHDRIVERVLERAHLGNDAINKRKSDWRAVERTVQAYVPASEAERLVKAEDLRKPISVVVPLSYANLDTLLTYMMSTYLSDTIFPFKGVGPEDVIGAALLEKHVENQGNQFKHAKALRAQLRDAFVYGIGINHTAWATKWGRNVRQTPNSWVSRMMGGPDAVTESYPDIIAEGNEIHNIDPYNFLPDPSVSIERIQDGEFVGWVCRESSLRLMREERKEGSIYFNIKYLPDFSGKSFIESIEASERDPVYSREAVDIRDEKQRAKNPDVIFMFIDIIPANWGLGGIKEPEKWIFGVANDSLVIVAQPMDLNHNMFPVNAFAPEADGYNVTPISKLMLTIGLQEAADWMISSHIHNVRKVMNDMLIVDPSIIQLEDLLDPGPGKIVRIARQFQGRGMGKDAVQQLNVQDVTQNNIASVGYFGEEMRRGTGTIDALQGIIPRSGERRSASETRDARLSALSRLDSLGQLFFLQSQYDTAYQIASHTQQFATKTSYTQVTGRYAEDLMAEYGPNVQRGRIGFDPSQMAIQFDVVPFNGRNKGGEFADSWIQLLQIASTNPQIFAGLDFMRIWLHIGRLMGAQNVEDFRLQAPMMNPMIVQWPAVLRQEAVQVR